MRRLVVLVALIALGLPGIAHAQSQPLPRNHPVLPGQRPDIFNPHAMQQRTLQQVDQLLHLGYTSRANALLDEAEAQGAPPSAVLPRRVAIAQAMGDHARAADLCRHALQLDPRDLQLWRELSMAAARLGDADSARIAADRFLALMPDPQSGFSVIVDQMRGAGLYGAALAVLDSARAVLDDPQYQPRTRALCLLRLGRPTEAAHEVAVDLRTTPFNGALARTELFSDDMPPLPEKFVEGLASEAKKAPPSAALAVLAAGCRLRQGDADAARVLVEPFSQDAAGAEVILRDLSSLSRELSLLAAGAELNATADYLLAELPVLGTASALPARLRQRAFEQLAMVCETALDRGLLADDPAAAAARYADLLTGVARACPQSEHLYAAEIMLARFTRDRLHEPAAAARRLEQLLMNLDLPLEGVALSRLALGECYLAAGDTARGRLVLTNLGRDADFPEAAGHAHFDLAKLDLAENHFGTARDRFAAVALDNPAAPYANDALGLGLIVAEEMQNPTGGPELLTMYARSLAFAITAQPDSQRTALERYIARASVQVDLEKPQALLEHARYELAELYLGGGDRTAALAQLDHIVLDQPAGRYAPEALAEQGRIRAASGDAQGARDAYERLLLQYPDYLFADEIRDRVRSLP